MNKYESYRRLLEKTLVEYYHLTEREAIEAVEQSSVNKMLNEKSAADWQMHQPLRSTVAEIYEEYEGNLIPV